MVPVMVDDERVVDDDRVVVLSGRMAGTVTMDIDEDEELEDEVQVEDEGLLEVATDEGLVLELLEFELSPSTMAGRATSVVVMS